MKNLRKFIVVAMAFVLAFGMMLMATGCGGSSEEEVAAINTKIADILKDLANVKK